uniref:CASP8-associated protein 2 n=1 Tax=Myripristis murdjan TaxID=586833 RepID=A0A667ZGW5_9TELE
DIYAGLDASPCNKSSLLLSPRLKESMDLYEEIVTEERQSRDSSYDELKKRFQAAQNQIEELRRRLQQMETQNTGLNTENCRLKKNISALLRTARQEVVRKDEEIQRLNQWSGRRQPRHQPHINGLWPSDSTRQTASSSPMSKPPPPAIKPPPPPPSTSSGQPPPSSPPREDNLQRSSPQLPRKESSCANLQPSASCVETTVSRSSDISKCSSRGEASVKQTDHSVRKSSGSSSSGHSEMDKHKQSKHREEKHQSPKLSESTVRKHKSGSDRSKECHEKCPEKDRSHKTEKEAGKKYDYMSCKTRNYPNAEVHHRSERAKSPPPEILPCAASSSSSTQGSSDDTKSRSRDRRQDKTRIATVDSVHSTASAHNSKESSKDSSESSKDREMRLKGHSRDHRKVRTGDGHSRKSSDSKDRKQSSSEQHVERSSESSKTKKRDSPSRDHRRKGERGCEDEIRKGDKRSSLSERGRESEKKRSKERDQDKTEVRSKVKEKKTVEASKRSSEEPNITGKNVVEENSPNRKLCFMETLNLTLSPVKKPLLLVNGSQQDSTPADKAFENGGKSDTEQPDVGVFFVIDELDSSQSEIGFDQDSDNKVAQHSPDLPKTPGSEITDEKCVSIKVCQEQDKPQIETTVAGEQLEDDSVQTTSAHCQQLTDNQTTNHSPKLPESSFVSVTDSVVSKNTSCNTEQGSDDKINEPGATACINGSPGSISTYDPCNFSQKINPENQNKETTINEPTVLDSSVETSTTAVPTSLSVDATKEDAVASPSTESPVAENDTGKAKLEGLHTSPSILPEESQQCPVPSASSNSTLVKEPSSSTGCVGVSKVSSTTEEMTLPEKCKSVLTFTPKKTFSPRKCHPEKDEGKIEPSSSMPLLHDEDSMMRTLSSLKSIPDAISPLRSPIRLTKRSHLHCHGKPAHVKSLRKDFSSTSVDASSMKLDVNKENKYPGSPSKHESQNIGDKASDPPSSLSDSELEEGEIVSESEEAATTTSPVSSPKRAKLSRPERNQTSSKLASRFSKKISEERCVASKHRSATGSLSTGSPSNKSRFKTVCPTASEVSFSTMEEVMEMLKTVRYQIRKKYMKLHKNFPKKSFYGMMDNFHESFLEFVDGARFGQICSEVEELKATLKKKITSVFNKVSNNGIVNRIFEQQAFDLKQKLWDFVDVQLDFLFKEINSTLICFCKPRKEAVDGKPSGSENVSKQLSVRIPSKSQCQKDKQSVQTSQRTIKPCAAAPCKTGLGSRGKDIRMIHTEKDRPVPVRPIPQTVVKVFSPNKLTSTPEKSNKASLVLSQSGSFQDRTDFEILTEQQASSLTFNLVRDSQMGEIFKCLLQGNDLLDSSATAGDSTAWSVSTPRKDGVPGESFITKFLSPTKFATPSKLITTWSGISPHKGSSPRSGVQVPLNPALFDESCLLEVPSESRTMTQSSVISQRSYSILAEDLAVSLTIPSPLKSDSTLSFLQPPTMDITSTPESVISAHLSEDALLDGEDATEHDIHLALDTDNSSCESSSSAALETAVTPLFQFKPHLPMQAVVMEKSNDHFILKIRQTATDADVTLTADQSLSQTLTEDNQPHAEEDMLIQESPSKAILSDESQKMSEQQKTTSPSKTTSHNSVCAHTESSETRQSSQVLLSNQSDSSRDEMDMSASDRSLVIAEEVNKTPEKEQKDCKMSRKRKKKQDKLKVKRPRKEEEKPKEGMVSKSPKDRDATSSKSEKSQAKCKSKTVSPSSLSAKNVIRKKGEVVVAWTRDEDRTILLHLKTKGASRETFSALSSMLNKSPAQIADRFAQLMKLFKKQEKMDS